jgi:hypothetical protein
LQEMAQPVDLGHGTPLGLDMEKMGNRPGYCAGRRVKMG